MGNRTLLAGAQVEPIAASLRKSFCKHRFEAVADPHNVIARVDSKSSANLSAQSVELVCLVDAFQGLPISAREHLLARLRDSLVSRILHFEYGTTDVDGWSLVNSLALGFRRVDAGAFKHRSWQLFEFDINTYKRTPRWLNADNWCNPQHWNRFRW